jgi:hypothetical protein
MADDAAQECRILVSTYLRYALENAKSALTLMNEPATDEAAYNFVVETLARMSVE